MKDIRIAVAGLGVAGALHARAVAHAAGLDRGPQAPGLHLAAAAGPDPDRRAAAARAFAGAQLRGDWRALADDPAIDAVVIGQSALRVLPRAQLVRAPFKVPHGGERPWPGRDTALRLACVGRLDLEDKGQDALLHVLARPPWRKRPVTLSLIGDGPHRALLQAMIREFALEDRVTLTGPVRDIQAVWDRHHALALASRAEGLPAVIVEAMLCGRPCVASDVAGNRELLDDGVTGFIARTPGDDDMAGALERLWAAPARLPAMGAAAAAAARAAVPPDPASVFADMLLAACP